ncbi:MAG: crossover junction endodeoxyribonuclease RuvC [Candidatus Uhrbacteria bacterium]|nr:crossover junction endodeoxyribonuclease RuvC [Patescibacteria group bacterium]MBU1907146.1 crossover junction endodeoxyribonuclease RuvC [Patescibacteria group bacterium]
MLKESKIIFGIDPGFDRCGFGVVRYDGHGYELIDTGCITTSKDLTHGERLHEVAGDLQLLLARHKPDMIAIEDLFFSKNVKTAMKVAESRGVALMIASEFNVPIIELNPNQIKLAICGDGRADKCRVQEMVTKVLKLKTIPESDDAADALAIAICAATINEATNLRRA